jgi:hypothetical protein
METNDWLHIQATVPIERNNWKAPEGQYRCHRKEIPVLAMNETPSYPAHSKKVKMITFSIKLTADIQETKYSCGLTSFTNKLYLKLYTQFSKMYTVTCEGTIMLLIKYGCGTI